jgi:hypothetical protein
MSEEEIPFKVGDKVVLPWLGPDQPEAVVTAISALQTSPSICLVDVVYEAGKELSLGSACLRPASEKAGLPAAKGLSPDSIALFGHPQPHPGPLLEPDWKDDELSEAALVEAVADWEGAVDCVASGYNYRQDFDEYDYDLFKRECVHALLTGFEHLKQAVPEALARRIAEADRRFRDLTVECDFVKSAQDYDPTAFWYYFRWPRNL